MANYHNPVDDPEEFRVCPYCRMQSRVKRWPYHLMKCKKNNPSLVMEICPFNASHIVRASELRYHIANCPDQGLIERTMVYDTKPVSTGNISTPSYEPDWQPQSEDWEEDATEPAFIASDKLRKTWESKTNQPVKADKSQRKPTGLPDCLSKTEESRKQEQEIARVLQNVSRGRGRGRGNIAEPPSVGSANQTMPAMKIPTTKPKSLGRGVTVESQVTGLQNGGSRGFGRGVMNFVQPVEVANSPMAPTSNTGVGRGRGQPHSFQSSSSPSPGAKFYVPNVAKGIDSAEQGDSNNENRDLLKEAKKIKKKLKAIENLESKQNQGIGLNAEEIEKVQRKSELEEELNKLMLTDQLT